MAGSIFTGDVIKSQLEDANRNYYGQRAWAKLFGDLNLSKQLGTENLMQNYGTIMGEAYAASKANQSAILGSNLGQGFKRAALEENQLALDKAYDSYMSQYLTEQQELNTAVAKQQSSLNKELDTLADMTAKYGNAHFDYLQSLWDKYEAGELTFNPFENPNFARYVNRETDVDGNLINTSLKSIGEIEGMVFDKQGNLTQAGIDFFDMLEHDQNLINYSFSDYLRENDEDLYEWGRTENPYNFAPNAGGLSINDATFRQMVGQSSLDEQYSFLERAYGMSDGSMESAFVKIQNTTNEFFDSLAVKKGIDGYKLKDKKVFKDVTQSYAEEFDNIVSELGLSEQLSTILKDRGYNTTLSYVESLINSYEETINKANRGITWDEASKNINDDAPIIGRFFETLFNYVGMSIDSNEILGGNITKSNEYIRNAFNSLISDLVNYSKSLND